jgi:heme O synthase-like polyprenyltransferase
MSSADVTVSAVPVWRDWLQLARISNTPTVVSNTVAGAALVAASPDAGTVAVVAIAMALFYTAGMVLNDVMDLEIDQRERPERPLPAGRISPGAALGAAVVLFVVGETMLVVEGWESAIAGLALIALIVLYDSWHKGNAVSPVLMGGCRALVYVVAGYAIAESLPWELWAGAGMLLLYIVGLTQVAKAEATGRSSAWPTAAVLAPVVFWAFLLPPLGFILLAAFAAWVLWALRLVRSKRIGPAVGAMIAGVSLFDAVAVASADGSLVAVAVCLAAFAVTIALQTKIQGT